ncbi:MAG: DUF2062 domain-containing protein [Bacteroidia bacterium]|nr:DUF2062 domain-containing protein [Bacteroidia bacterium]
MKSDVQQQWNDRLHALGVCVIMPTYNNAGTVAQVIAEVRQYTSDLIVINDGSTDETPTILHRLGTLNVLHHRTNQGKGAALKNGLALAKAGGYRYAITIDSDGQHFASDIPRFIEAIEQEPDTLLVGARNLTADNMPGKNTFANKFSNFWYKLETGIALDDTQSGYRLYPLHVIQTDGFWYTTKYEFELEAIVFAAWRGVTVKNIPIHVYYPPQEERVSHFRPLRDFTRISLLNTLLVLITFLWIKPRDLFRKFTWNHLKRSIDTHVIHTKESNRKISLAVMLGIFMGIVPIWGYQMLATLFLAHLFKLNKTIAILTANISIPPMIPLLLYGSYLTGCKVLGQTANLQLGNLSLENVTTVLEQYLIGSIIFALICSSVAGLLSISLLALCRKKKL